MSILLEVATKPGLQFPVSFTLVYVVGFIAAVAFGSLVLYKLKRPVGW